MSQRSKDRAELHERRVVSSALWAAAGDALGWITELAREGTVQARTGSRHVDKPVNWVRQIGGRGGPQIQLPAGTYSDDTQLRLAVCRAIRGDGVFDAEAFGRIELTVWQGYALGAGLGTKAAATNLAKRGVNWFSNFFESKSQSYARAGGNGAAMRVQPHAWLNPENEEELTLSVMRDALVTHGHPHGFMGAVFHASSVRHALRGGLPAFEYWERLVESLRLIPDVVRRDRQLEAFWRPAWEHMSGASLEESVEKTSRELQADLNVVASILSNNKREAAYAHVLDAVGLRSPKFRGSGLKTAMAASVLASLFRDNPQQALIVAANELDSDTDTIATMAGAIIGAATDMPLEWPLQDRAYIEGEARRVARISMGIPVDSFNYPDLGRWKPPANQSSCIARLRDGFALAGLGYVDPISEEYHAADAVWQWMLLPFGQTILAKRRPAPPTLDSGQLPGERRMINRPDVQVAAQPQLALSDPPKGGPPSVPEPQSSRTSSSSLDQLTDYVISSDFSALVIGEAFNKLIDQGGTIEQVIAFASIIAKAKLARAKRRSR